ncbi:trypsin-like peptidase domain-containing protein [Mucilaginibacter sp. KACC 22773]|uniref:trypsin-like peptidase domain-containing protein n=1 Tax=Mucilaginibacter sp. KACC 22773 TaxID=3025671 RepID=UPI0023670AE7|nr:trypsin-like peptidase domain-containing protein [Mucilaginibacter sp. KACC 22773]WDF77186.1 trypsin-like peptidase domain-containing protein [Mucilaginibacter sp. KACC 22773]
MRSINIFCLLAFFVCCLVLLNQRVEAQHADQVSLEKQIKNVIAKVAPASVFLADYDPKLNILTGTTFSGVVVTSDGVILTAAHVCHPDKNYIVIFNNGRRAVAKGYGRIQSLDLAIMKITEPGDYPFAPIGWSSSLEVDEPCLSIAYPESLNRESMHTAPQKFKTPAVRLGYIAETAVGGGKRLRTTCLMEPGDSGGPVFDLHGRVIGVHSSIQSSLDDNFEVPVDYFRKYWKSLNIAQDYRMIPDAEIIPPDPLLSGRPKTLAINQLESSFTALKSELSDYSVNIVSIINGKPGQILGTAVSPDGLAQMKEVKRRGFVITKNSMLGDSIKVQLPDGNFFAGKVITRDKKNDLALIQIDARLKKCIRLSAASTDSVGTDMLGTLLLSAKPGKTGIVSVLGGREFELRYTYATAYLGAQAENKSGGLLLTIVMPEGPADHILKLGDEILTVDNVKVTTEEAYLKQIHIHAPGDTLMVTGIRDKEPFSYHILLGKRPDDQPDHVALHFTGGRSERFDGFMDMFIHDGRIKPAECGGPLFDIHGNFIGINMARFSRTTTIGTSARGIQIFIRSALPFILNTAI